MHIDLYFTRGRMRYCLAPAYGPLRYIFSIRKKSFLCSVWIIKSLFPGNGFYLGTDLNTSTLFAFYVLPFSAEHYAFLTGLLYTVLKKNRATVLVNVSTIS